MNGRRSAMGLALAAFAVAILTSSLASAACETPLSTQNASAAANVMIILDNSGSMNSPIWHDAYDQTIAYSGNFTRTTDYNVSSSANYTPRSFNSGWPASPTAFLVKSDGGRAGTYDGNYLNWVYFHADTTQRAAIPRVTRIQVAKQVVNGVIGAGGTNRYGIMTYNGDAGGTLTSPMGTAVSTMQSQVNAVVATSWTPLAETMVTTLDYFKLTTSSAPIQASCQKSFLVIVTDGHPTQDLNVPSYLQDYDGDGMDPGNCASIGAPFPNSYNCSGYMDDVAMYMFRNDLRPDMTGMQNVTTYCIGFNIYAPLLESAATEGGGVFFSANNSAQLAFAMNGALALIASKVAASSAVSVVSSEDRTSNRIYRARFETVTWRGYLDAFALPYQDGDTPLWEAGALLSSRSPSSREIFTSTTGTNKADFTTSNAANLTSLLGAANSTEAGQIIDYARGSAVTGMRERDGWKLGDIVDAAPLAVGKPSEFNSFLSYSGFQSSHAGRTEMIYAGANDGMLHAIDATTGTESWAYVPKNQLSKLSQLMNPAYCHGYFVNMTPAVHDMYIGGGWKTVLVGGQERGGSGLFALDVTDPSSSQMQVLWDVNLPELKGSWNRPELVRDHTLNAHVLCVGTGFDSTSGQASLLALDPANGSVLSTFNLGSVVSPNMTTGATALDRDFDGYDDLLYLGDLAGHIWRVDLTTNPWTVSKLFDCGQPIQATPVLSMDENGHVLLFFGTGSYLRGSDLATTGNQTLYAITDDHSGALLTRSNLVDQTSSINVVSNSSRGWFIDLVQHAGERIIRSPALVAGTLFVPSFRPKTGVCEGGGESWLYSVDFEDGSRPDNSNGTERNTTTGRVQSMGDGILSNPSADLVNNHIILQSSNTSLITQNIDAPLRRLMVRSWRQVWNGR